MNWHGSGFITIINYASGSEAEAETFTLNTEDGFDILTEDGIEILVEST